MATLIIRNYDNSTRDQFRDRAQAEGRSMKWILIELIRYYIKHGLPAAVLLLTLACGGSSPTAPGPAPTLPANLVPVLGEEARAELTDQGWRFTFAARNSGQGCADQVAGTTTFKDQAGTKVLDTEWALPPTHVVKSGEAFTYATCCLVEEQAKQASQASTVFRWTNVGC